MRAASGGEEGRKEGAVVAHLSRARPCRRLTTVLFGRSRESLPEQHSHHHSTPTSPPTSRLDLLKVWPPDSRPHPRAAPSEALGVQPRNLHSGKPSRGLNVGFSVSPTALDHPLTSIARQATPELPECAPGAPAERAPLMHLAFPQSSGAPRPGPKRGHCLPPSVCPHLKGTSLLQL